MREKGQQSAKILTHLTLWPEYAARKVFHEGEKKLLGAPYFGMPCKIYELFRLVSFTENYGGYAYIRITSTINTMVIGKGS